jgi:hypothetical protein
MATLSLAVDSISRPAVLWRAGLGVLAVFAVALALGLATLANVDSARAWYAAAENVSRFSVLVFLIFLVRGPASYFVPSAVPASNRSEAMLLLAFTVAYATSLAFIVGRVCFTNTHAPAATLMFCAFAAVVPIVLTASAQRRFARLLGWQIVRSAAIVYFWLIFALSGLGHFYGPHRPDLYFATSLVLLLAALLLRATATLARTLHRAKPAIAARALFGDNRADSHQGREGRNVSNSAQPSARFVR